MIKLPIVHHLEVTMSNILEHFLPGFFPSFLIHSGRHTHKHALNKSCCSLSAYCRTSLLGFSCTVFHFTLVTALRGRDDSSRFTREGGKLARFEQGQDMIRFYISESSRMTVCKRAQRLGERLVARSVVPCRPGPGPTGAPSLPPGLAPGPCPLQGAGNMHPSSLLKGPDAPHTKLTNNSSPDSSLFSV